MRGLILADQADSPRPGVKPLDGITERRERDDINRAVRRSDNGGAAGLPFQRREALDIMPARSAALSMRQDRQSFAPRPVPRAPNFLTFNLGVYIVVYLPVFFV